MVDLCWRENLRRADQRKGGMMNINKECHHANPMPSRASLDERIQWHLQHQKACACRPIPPKLLAEMTKRRLE